MREAYFIGIDIGTQGTRVAILNEKGMQLAAREEAFLLNEHTREEQSPELWWDCCSYLIPLLLDDVRADIQVEKIKAVTVTSTSGTIIPLDHNFNPLHPAIMYSDQRSSDEAKMCMRIARKEVIAGYNAFNTSSGLPKMKWLLNRYPGISSLLYKFIHAADFITGRLCGEYGTTDYTNSLKSGYNIHEFKWPAYIAEQVGISKGWLQQVKPSGTPLGTLLPALAAEWRLPHGVVVTTGITDGCASQVAAGAVSPGQWNTTVGTTLVIKGVTKEELKDSTGALYNHRHPDGYWMPGGASNTGSDWVRKFFAEDNLQELGVLAAAYLPAKHLAWPLLQQGERFPFVASQAAGFWPEENKVEKFTACMEGVAFIERYAYERISALSGEKITSIFSAGGGSNNDTWLHIRSNVLNVPVCKMKNVSGAAGAAILAASRTFYNSLQQAAGAMVYHEKRIEPEQGLVRAYEKKYQEFIKELKTRKIIG